MAPLQQNYGKRRSHEGATIIQRDEEEYPVPRAPSKADLGEVPGHPTPPYFFEKT